ncbi:aspartate/glutamate racemase family protein [Robbsia sp. Bb-Pol-6]|uniref:Aspartate/glutamate racemase family protein n=1 Tax=Robbsia betulipollinis TaxID=2981849 RepID=A0ABT3ZS50_9BURK|nr:aspartate/glutamate racemase family protein [Robbsia betulipollinis]MCY0389242.1 aspartate/glutamate racemase family protein [Robbsia betulipollinis]
MTAPGTLGILMLDTRFPRPPGDAGNPASYRYPVRRRGVADATPARVVHDRAAGLVDGFVEAAVALERAGCRALITSCGFMVLHQSRLAAAVRIPVAASALLLLPLLQASFGPRARIGVLTASAAALGAAHLAAAGARSDTPVAGVRADGEFARVILGDAATGDFARIGEEIVDAAVRLAQATPGLAAIVLECTNMPPYRDAIRVRCGVPVFDLIDLADLLMR